MFVERPWPVTESARAGLVARAPAADHDLALGVLAARDRPDLVAHEHGVPGEDRLDRGVHGAVQRVHRAVALAAPVALGAGEGERHVAAGLAALRRADSQSTRPTVSGTSATCCSTIAIRSASVTSFLRVGEGDRLAVDEVELLALQVVAQLSQLALEPLAAGQLADRQLAPGQADRLGGHDLVGQRVLDDAVLVDARLVGERVRAHDGLVRLDDEAGEVADEPAGRRDLLGRDAADEPRELGGSRAEGHHDLLQGGVAGALAEAVDGDLHLAGARLHGRERVGRGEAEVVVAVDGDDRLAAGERLHALHERAELGRDRVADRVRDVQGGGAGLQHGRVDLQQVVRVGARGVLGGELDLGVAAELLAPVADPADRLGERLVAVDAQLVLEVDVARRDEDVEMRALGDADRLHGPLRVAVLAAGERGDGDALRLLGDPADRLEVAGRGGREAGLDDVHLEARELPGDLELLGDGEAGAGRLLAVAQGGVEDADAARRVRRGRRWVSSSSRAPLGRSLGLACLDGHRVEEGHPRPQLRADLLDLVAALRLPHPLELGAAGPVLLDPASRERPVLDLREDLHASWRARRSSTIRGPET